MKIISHCSRQLFLLLVFVFTLTSCKNDNKQEEKIIAANEEIQEDLFFKLSLAQWSLNKPIFAGELDPMDFAQKAHELGFDGIEYVNQFYTPLFKDAEDPEAALQAVLDTLKSKSEEFGVENVLIMVDGEGDLATGDQAARRQAVDNHKKWVDAAEFLGAHSIRVNLFGSDDPEEWKQNASAGLSELSEYAAQKNINVIVENHGGLSSNAKLLVEVIEQVNMENCGTLPDFGNFCIKREAGSCVDNYPVYQGIEEMMEYAKAVSAKSYDFNEETGEETTLDFSRILRIVKDAGYTGFIGVEYEGNRLSSEEGIIATRDLLIREGKKLQD
ncbi:sugar phosphate isomerase/epimerase family protein [Salinimicrobium xinjiangense]|uniref:sugar phosphate isomerase/epimerase family protein n=1 Tax=Salinimicrobium xinjiangense TaxID=438596 RepID=UPI000415E55B|nr:sugar phosphate isomerase/epimerase family protein [Salinimicrobium xinjiangense]